MRTRPPFTAKSTHTSDRPTTHLEQRELLGHRGVYPHRVVKVGLGGAGLDRDRQTLCAAATSTSVLVLVCGGEGRQRAPATRRTAWRRER